MPKKLMQDVSVGKENKENNRMAEYLKYDNKGAMEANEAAQEVPDEQAPPQ
jgi:hypothetical protein